MITRESDGESLAWYRSAAGIIFNSSLFEYFSIQQITLIYVTIYSFILECLQYQNYGLSAIYLP